MQCDDFVCRGTAQSQDLIEWMPLSRVVHFRSEYMTFRQNLSCVSTKNFIDMWYSPRDLVIYKISHCIISNGIYTDGGRFQSLNVTHPLLTLMKFRSARHHQIVINENHSMVPTRT